MFADAIGNEKQCYMFSVDQRHFAHYSLHSIHKKSFQKVKERTKLLLFFIQIFVQCFSLRGRIDSNVLGLKKKYSAPVIKTNFCTFAIIGHPECIFVEMMEFGKEY